MNKMVVRTLNNINGIPYEKKTDEKGEYTFTSCSGAEIKTAIVPGGVDENGDYNIKVAIAPNLVKEYIFKTKATGDEERTLKCLIERLDECVNIGEVTSETKLGDIFDGFLFKCNEFETIAEGPIVHVHDAYKAELNGYNEMEVMKTGENTLGQFFSINWGDE